MSKLLEGKKVLVTGGSRGIGRAIAIAAANEGAEVIISYNQNLNAALDVIQTITAMGVRAHALKLDLENPEQIKEFTESATVFFGHIDILINNAADLIRKPFLETSPDEIDKLYRTNLRGAYLLSQAVIQTMINTNSGGVIINISSDRDTTVTDDLSAYQIMKAGLKMLTEILARDFASNGIRVNTIAPGMIKTDMHKSLWQNQPLAWQQRTAKIPLRRAGTDEEIANTVVFVASDKSSYTTGSRILVDGGRTTGPAKENVTLPKAKL